MKICLLNESKSFLFHFFHKSKHFFHFSPAGKKAERIFLCVFEKTRVSCYRSTLRGKQKYQVTNVGLEKIKLSRLLVQRINEFKINEIQRKIPHLILKPS